MKEAIRSLAHIAAIAALTLIVVIAVVALLMATGCKGKPREEDFSASILGGSAVEKTAIPSPEPLTAQSLYDDFKASATFVPIRHMGGVVRFTHYGSTSHGNRIGWQRSKA